MGNGKEQNEGDQDIGEGDSFALNYFKKNTSTQDIGALDKLHQIQKNRRKHRVINNSFRLFNKIFELTEWIMLICFNSELIEFYFCLFACDVRFSLKQLSDFSE